MTTIATDGKSMAADGRATCGRMIVSESQAKIRRLKDGSLLATAGLAGADGPFSEWLEAGQPKDGQPKWDDFEALLLKPDGTAWQCGESMVFIQRELPTAAGSGEQFAIGAMEAGASPAEAVAIACKRDTITGGKITVLHLHRALAEVA